MRRMHCSSKSASCSSRRPIPWQYSKQVLGPKIQTSFHVCGQYYQPFYLTSVRMIYKIACFANMTVFFRPAPNDSWGISISSALASQIEMNRFRNGCCDCPLLWRDYSSEGTKSLKDLVHIYIIYLMFHQPIYVACHHPKYTTIGYLFWG